MDLIQILPIAPTAALIFFKTEITIKEENSKENSSPGSPIAFSFHVSWVSLNRGQCLSLFGFFFFSWPSLFEEYKPAILCSNNLVLSDVSSWLYCFWKCCPTFDWHLLWSKWITLLWQECHIGDAVFSVYHIRRHMLICFINGDNNHLAKMVSIIELLVSLCD